VAKVKPEGVRCGTCGRVHPGLPTEWGFREPDEVLALPYIAKYLRTRIKPDGRTANRPGPELLYRFAP
jgi:hypothetical protein